MVRIVAVLVAMVVGALLPAAASAQVSSPCPMVTPAMPPVAGTKGFVFIAQHCPAEEDRVPGRFTVTVDFGDGTTGPGQLTPDAFIAGGVHRYERAGTYRTKAVVRNVRTGAETTLRGVVKIRAPFVQAKRPPLRFTVGELGFNQTLVAFESVLPYHPSEVRATVAWGDGTRSRGTVRKGAGRTFTVWGRHRYKRMRNRTLKVTVTHKSGAKAVLRAEALVGRVFDVLPSKG